MPLPLQGCPGSIPNPIPQRTPVPIAAGSWRWQPRAGGAGRARAAPPVLPPSPLAPGVGGASACTPVSRGPPIWGSSWRRGRGRGPCCAEGMGWAGPPILRALDRALVSHAACGRAAVRGGPRGPPLCHPLPGHGLCWHRGRGGRLRPVETPGGAAWGRGRRAPAVLPPIPALGVPLGAGGAAPPSQHPKGCSGAAAVAPRRGVTWVSPRGTSCAGHPVTTCQCWSQLRGHRAPAPGVPAAGPGLLHPPHPMAPAVGAGRPLCPSLSSIPGPPDLGRAPSSPPPPARGVPPRRGVGRWGRWRWVCSPQLPGPCPPRATSRRRSGPSGT